MHHINIINITYYLIIIGFYMKISKYNAINNKVKHIYNIYYALRSIC